MLCTVEFIQPFLFKKNISCLFLAGCGRVTIVLVDDDWVPYAVHDHVPEDDVLCIAPPPLPCLDASSVCRPMQCHAVDCDIDNISFRSMVA